MTSPTMFWKLSDVQIGYENRMAQQFNIEGAAPDVTEMLPLLDVDEENPYSKRRWSKAEGPKADSMVTLSMPHFKTRANSRV